jgi:hypothetical protein
LRERVAGTSGDHQRSNRGREDQKNLQHGYSPPPMRGFVPARAKARRVAKPIALSTRL